MAKNTVPDETALSMEDALILRAVSGEADAFGVLYVIYQQKIYDYINRRVDYNQSVAEDLTSKTFEKALKAIKKYKHQAGVPFGPWLYRIAHNVVVNHHRDEGRKRIVHSFEDLADRLRAPKGQTPDAATEAREIREALIAAIRRLPSDRQQLLRLKFTERLPNEKIAQIMGRTVGAIKSLYHRTLDELREDLESRGFH